MPEDVVFRTKPEIAPDQIRTALSPGSLANLIDLAKPRIERDYEELKQEIGLGHYEGRGRRGFHHHGTLAIAAYGSWSPSGV